MNNKFVLNRDIRFITTVTGIFYFCLLSFGIPAYGKLRHSENERYNENRVFKESLKSVKLYKEGWGFSHPVLLLGSEQGLILVFDDLSNELKNYSYTITHCNYEWEPSGLAESEYVDGFFENTINDYQYSINTTINYINYTLPIPNEDIRIKLSGNYLLTVWEDYNRDLPVLVRRLYVVESGVSIQGGVKKATFDGYKGERQEVDFNIDYSNFSLHDPRSEIKVVIMQNFRADNAITELKPLYITGSSLSYDYDRENVFLGGSEFRNFDLKDLRVTGKGIHSIGFHDPLYHVTLKPEQSTYGSSYQYKGDINGRYLVHRNSSEDSSLEADYLFVHFSLTSDVPLTGGEVYIFGELSDWQCSAKNRMNYNFEQKRYELSLLLKQGFYDYKYVYIENGSSDINTNVFESSHFETENDYQIFVYYCGISSRFDRLIGFRSLNSISRESRDGKF